MEEKSLFESQSDADPLAERLRPETLDGFVGQRQLLGPGKILRRLIESDRIASMIFWGPPGVGKTTLARIIARQTKSSFIDFSAVTSGIKEIRGVMQKAEDNRRYGERTIVFVDEIHRFNKAQQDAFLPFVEKGSIILIGATTENPSFEINSALLSRCKVFVLQALSPEDLTALLTRALREERGFGGQKVAIASELLKTIANFANGDARMALSTLEMAILNGDEKDGTVTVTKETLEQCVSRRSLLYDKKGEEHYNLISALHKSMRNSDPDAAVYWLARMLEAGEDPLYIARRIVRFAAEDVGLADPRALEIAVAAYQACHFIGVPECNVHLTEAAIYLAVAPKSNAMEAAYLAAKKDALSMIDEPVPLVIRNAPTSLMKDLGYGQGYQYAHDTADKLTNIVFMGQGEPMDNLDNILRTTEILTADYGWAWSPKRITVSSVGVKNKLKRFIEESDCHVAISLHSPIAEQRAELMPAQKGMSIAEIVELLRNYDFSHQRRLSFEYIVFGGVNDSMTHARELVKLLKGLDCRINLIRFHQIPDVPLHGADEKRMEELRDYLTSHGIFTTIRASRGQDIFAACGLLSTSKKIGEIRHEQ